jgi:hypothetical protein
MVRVIFYIIVSVLPLGRFCRCLEHFFEMEAMVFEAFTYSGKVVKDPSSLGIILKAVNTEFVVGLRRVRLWCLFLLFGASSGSRFKVPPCSFNCLIGGNDRGFN